MSMDGGWCRHCGQWEMEADDGECESCISRFDAEQEMRDREAHDE